MLASLKKYKFILVPHYRWKK